jgi:hypothetical protein
MTLIEDIEATNDVAVAVASALEQVLCEDVIRAVGVAQREAPSADLLVGLRGVLPSPGINGEISHRQ